MLNQTPLEQLTATYPSMLVGFSGGVDSTLLAVVGRKVLGKEKCLAVLGMSPSLSGAQEEQAESIAREFDLNFTQVKTHEMDDPRYSKNSRDRCYFCKSELWDRLSKIAQDRGYGIVADGTNASDLNGHRPGARAAAELGVRSPLAEVGYTKERVRSEARDLGIPIWNAPSSPCLSSRIMYGLSVTPARLRQVEQGEDLLRSLGVRGDLRVRHRGQEARIEVMPSEFAKIRVEGDRVATVFRNLGFERVTLDLAGYRTGSLLSGDSSQLEIIEMAR